MPGRGHPLVERLYARRIALGLKQTEAADRADMDRSSFARFENGPSFDPRVSTIERVAGALGLVLMLSENAATPKAEGEELMSSKQPKPRRPGADTRAMLKAQTTKFSNRLTAHGLERRPEDRRPITLPRIPSLEKPLEEDRR